MSKFDRDFDSRYDVFDDYDLSQAETIHLKLQGPSVIQGVSHTPGSLHGAIANVNPNRFTNQQLAAIYGGVYPGGWSYVPQHTSSNTANTTHQSSFIKADAQGVATEITVPAIDDLKKQYEELKKQVASLEQKNSSLILALNKVVARLENLEQQQASRQAPGGYWEET